MECTLEEGKAFSDGCSTLLLPALSIGNVGQLAIDLLISSTGAGRVGFLDEPSVLPCVGNDAYGPTPIGDLALPLEAYESSSHSVALIQQRSPVMTGMMVDFAKNLAHFVLSAGKRHVVILSSLDSGKRKNIDESSQMQIYYISSANADGSDGRCEQLGWKRLKEYTPSERRWKDLENLAEGKSGQEDADSFEDELLDDDYYASLPFAALFTCCKAQGLDVTCLLCYCSEGDNIADSFQLAEAACSFVGLTPEKFHGNEPGGWTIPLSWKTVYGPPPDISIF
ncbi:proteasome assembly chaperone 2 [Iris pallida]|uniref:Proteasome assembly chaperone 2 n=1 Tax=Iris pallida TaxID=29817 RepID=A0AAX6HXH5_IRIPA|nr:proteasome assembly chaperone 2 [Iris pallida]KAJ6844925.1 proteasome assembly chaperone 2 [Iris pallida]